MGVIESSKNQCPVLALTPGVGWRRSGIEGEEAPPSVITATVEWTKTSGDTSAAPPASDPGVGPSPSGPAAGSRNPFRQGNIGAFMKKTRNGAIDQIRNKKSFIRVYVQKDDPRWQPGFKIQVVTATTSMVVVTIPPKREWLYDINGPHFRVEFDSSPPSPAPCVCAPAMGVFDSACPRHKNIAPGENEKEAPPQRKRKPPPPRKQKRQLQQQQQKGGGDIETCVL